MPKELKPDHDCPKCGGAFEDDPYYERGPLTFGEPLRDWLEWKCSRCGYREESDCLDAARSKP